MNEKKTYNPAIDLLRIIAILAVVLVHTTTRTLEVSHYYLDQIPFTLFLNQIARFAVPLFFLISGFVLELNYPFHANYLTYLKKRFNKILIPYVFWSAIYYFFVYTHHKINFFQTLLGGNASYQLYFIPSLLIFYLLFPFIHRYYQTLSKKSILLVLGSLQLILLSLDYYAHAVPFFYPINIVLLNYFVFFLGVSASHHHERIMTFIKKWISVITLMAVATGLFIFFEGRYFYLKTHNYLSFYSQWRPSVFFYTLFLTPSLYYFLSQLKLGHGIKKFSHLSFFVFFVHVIVLETAWDFIEAPLFKDNPQIIHQVWYDPLWFLLVSGISFLLAYVVRKLPFASKITG